MPDLATQLRSYVDSAAPPVTLDEVEGHRLVAAPHRAHGRRRWLAVAAVIVLVAAGAFLATRPSDPVQTIVTGPGALDWLTPFGAEQPMPAIPDGWKLVDFEAVRVAVPADWPVVDWCRPVTTSDGAVVLPGDGTEDFGCVAELDTTYAVRIGRGDGAPGLAKGVGSYSINVSSSGNVGDPPGPTVQVAKSFTDSGARRALQEGPVADTAGWQTVGYSGVNLRVPPTWAARELTSGRGLDPGVCGAQMFPLASPTVALGTSPGQPSCAVETEIGASPGEGVWLRPAGADPSATPATRGTIGGLEVTVVDLPSEHPEPTLDLVIDTGEHWVWMSLGVGTDASVARAILRSIHRA